MATHLLPQDVRDLLSRLAISDSEESKLTGVNKYRSSEDLSGLIARIKVECPGRANDLTRYGNDSEIRRRIKISLREKKRDLKRKSKKVKKVVSAGTYVARPVLPQQNPASSTLPASPQQDQGSSMGVPSGLASVSVNAAPLNPDLEPFIENL